MKRSELDLSPDNGWAVNAGVDGWPIDAVLAIVLVLFVVVVLLFLRSQCKSTEDEAEDVESGIGEVKLLKWTEEGLSKYLKSFICDAKIIINIEV